MKKITLLFLIFTTIVSLCACTTNNTTPDGSVNFGDYVIPTEPGSYSPENTTAAQSVPSTSVSYDSSQLIDSDVSWQNAYALSYSYFDQKTGVSTITEGKCGKYYQSIDDTSKIVTFLSQEDGYMLQYMLDSTAKTGTVTAVTNADIDSAYSGFLMISACDPYFPVYKNVTKVADDFVAQRSATRYKQVQTENGETTKIAYVWIDDELGFASKCELYDAKTQEVLMRWELLDFTTNVKEENVKVNIDAYNIVTQ